MYGNHGEGPKPPKKFPAAAVNAAVRRARNEERGEAVAQRARGMAFSLATAPAFGGVQ